MSLEEEARVIADGLRANHGDFWSALLLPLGREARYVEERVRASDPALWEYIIGAGLQRARGLA